MTYSDEVTLKKSLSFLIEITNQVYSDGIREVALKLWNKDLVPHNPQWKYIKFKSFHVKHNKHRAHVFAMIDKRLPGIGIVGYFACTDVSSGSEVLNLACEWLKIKQGIRSIYGPINGTLPNDYRLNLSNTFSFPGEPVNPEWYIDAFKNADFKIFHQYVSGVSKRYLLLMKLAMSKPKSEYNKMIVRSFDQKNYSRDFIIYHNLRNAIFPHQSIYCPPISLEERIFNSNGKINHKYTFFLVDDSREVGFIMAYVYNNDLIIKTIGMLPEYRGKRLKGMLLKPIRNQAKSDGLRSCIYSTVRVGNRIYKSRSPGVRIFRKYVTMHRKI